MYHHPRAGGTMAYRGTSSDWPIEEALCEVTEGLCRIMQNKAPWTSSYFYEVA